MDVAYSMFGFRTAFVTSAIVEVVVVVDAMVFMFSPRTREDHNIGI